MAAKSIKRLRSVVHSTAHHAESFLSYMHPHLGKICLELKLRQIKLDLLTGSFSPTLLKLPKPLELASKTLCTRFKEIMALEKLEPSWLSDASAEFLYINSEWPQGCVVSVTTLEGRNLEAAVSMGLTARVLRGA